MLQRLLIVLLLLVNVCVYGFSGFQKNTADSVTFSRGKLAIVAGSFVVSNSLITIGLNQFWYRDYPRSSFHWFNDNKEWMQMDKFGHATSSYYMGKLASDALRWTGLECSKSTLYGGVAGLVFLSGIEYLDGRSAQWGASVGDIAANVSGALFFIGQELTWKEQRIMLKYSAHFSPYAQYRPNVLGSSWNERLLKDYNGQTYWLSFNIKSFIGSETVVPSWLNIALGYSADGMTGGEQNVRFDEKGNSIPSFERQRQYFFSLDVDLTRIKTKSTAVNTLLNAFGFVKFPMPAYEFGTKTGLKGHFLYF